MRENLSSPRPHLTSFLKFALVVSDMLVTHEEVHLAVGVLAGEADGAFEGTTIGMLDPLPMDILVIQTVAAHFSNLDDLLSLPNGHLSEARTSGRELGIMILIEICCLPTFLKSMADPALLVPDNVLEEGSKVARVGLLLTAVPDVNIRVQFLSLLTKINDVGLDRTNFLLRVTRKLHKVLVDAPREEILQLLEDGDIEDLRIVVLRASGELC